MTIAERAKYYYLDLGKNCAIATLMATSDVYDLGLTLEDAKLIAGFGGGMGCGSTCGCLAGAIAALGKLYADKEEIKTVAAAYAAVFKEAMEMGTWDCGILHDHYFAEGYRCFACVELSAKALQAFIEEKGL